ncbi:hypothetical protein DRW03_12565 [Corallococcus sp. H22C18031201]|uniref:hypothetical protein n=1 Tax=Citreicoccus inhibens TaxID=2849499 RepID=UPI000E73A230|nr:hypothetical protein [Citreicoccus inhibens]MBU8894145.1 hypothetical protein [Citreicoccus inhibens]RJS23150.1 hypothetical protein DRW03_12565 [Corallococcus sp. H22C18031201]
MKPSLLPALAVLALSACAHQSPSERARSHADAEAEAKAGQGIPPPDTASAEAVANGEGSSEEKSWDPVEEPRTQSMLRAHGLNFYEGYGEYYDTGGATQREGNARLSSRGAVIQEGCVEVGTGGAGAVQGAASGLPSPRNYGARFDPSPQVWKANKGIGTSPAVPSTGTPPEEGSGGASGH